MLKVLRSCVITVQSAGPQSLGSCPQTTILCSSTSPTSDPTVDCLLENSDCTHRAEVMTFYLPNRSCPCVPGTHSAAHVGRLGGGHPSLPPPHTRLITSCYLPSQPRSPDLRPQRRRRPRSCLICSMATASSLSPHPKPSWPLSSTVSFIVRGLSKTTK